MKRVILPLVLTVFLSGCGAVRIGRILDEPNRYRNRSVRVDGKVTRSYGALVTGVYQLDDGSGKIYVISNSGVPRQGSEVRVKGKVMNGVTIGTRNFGTAIREENHHVR